MNEIDEQARLKIICDRLADGCAYIKIAEELGISNSALSEWISSNPERSARARESRAAAASIWDEKAETVLSEAPDEFELKKARELAHHYRWRASKIAPRDYGDKADVTHGGGVTIRIVDEFPDN